LPQYQSTEREFLLLEVRLDQSVLSNAIPAYELGEHTLLPLGALGPVAHPRHKNSARASNRQRLYSHRGIEGLASIWTRPALPRAGVTESFDPALALTEPDDIYIAKSLLERWLPVET